MSALDRDPDLNRALAQVRIKSGAVRRAGLVARAVVLHHDLRPDDGPYTMLGLPVEWSDRDEVGVIV